MKGRAGPAHPLLQGQGGMKEGGKRDGQRRTEQQPVGAIRPAPPRPPTCTMESSPLNPPVTAALGGGERYLLSVVAVLQASCPHCPAASLCTVAWPVHGQHSADRHAFQGCPSAAAGAA